LQHKKSRESEGDKNKDKKIVMVKLMIKTHTHTHTKSSTTIPKCSVCSAKVLDLFLWHPILVLALGILVFVGKGDAPLVGQLGQ
jgi:hypothetical protein